MFESPRVDLGAVGDVSLSRKRAVRTVGAAVCCMAFLAFAASSFARHESSALFLPATVGDLFSKHVESAGVHKDLAAAQGALSLDKQTLQLRMLQQIANSIKLQESKLKVDMSMSKGSTSHRDQEQAPVVKSAGGAHVLAAATSLGSVKGKNVRLTFQTDETATRANSIAAEAQKRWQELHKNVQKAIRPAAASSGPASSAAAARSPSAIRHGNANQDDLTAMAAKADDEASSAVDAADAQRVVVAREASTYMKAEKRALAVQEKAARAEAKADTARALVEDAVADNAEAHAKVLRRRAARASAKAAKYAGQIKTLNDDFQSV
jgi:hypothetical protein